MSQADDRKIGVSAGRSEFFTLRDREPEHSRFRRAAPLWRSQIGRVAPAHLSRNLLVRILAYRQQAQARGDLDRATLLALATAMGHGNAASGATAIVTGPRHRPDLRAGTLLMREHEGALHRVMVLDHGFAWNGKTFASLSRVARAITGTHWNGPRFFGLRDKNSRREANP